MAVYMASKIDPQTLNLSSWIEVVNKIKPSIYVTFYKVFPNIYGARRIKSPAKIKLWDKVLHNIK